MSVTSSTRASRRPVVKTPAKNFERVAEFAAHLVACFSDRRYGPRQRPQNGVLADSLELLRRECEAAGLMDEYRAPEAGGYWLGPEIRFMDAAD